MDILSSAHPVMLQRYNRTRAIKVLESMERKEPAKPESAPELACQA